MLNANSLSRLGISLSHNPSYEDWWATKSDSQVRPGATTSRADTDTLDLQVARGKRTAPRLAAPDLKVISGAGACGMRRRISLIWQRMDSRWRIWATSSITKSGGW